MRLVYIHNHSVIKEILEQDPYLHIYGLGDIDELFRPFTCWYGLEGEGKIASIAYIYMGSGIPTVLAFSDDTAAALELLKRMISILPHKFFAHFSPGLEEVLRKDFDFQSELPHYKMALTDAAKLNSIDTSGVSALTEDDIPALIELYNDSYPGNWFEPEMLSFNRYFGIKDGGRLLSAAGTHVYSPALRASALGNIATRTECRGMGYGSKVTAALSCRLIDDGLRVGLNVQADNNTAVSCYTKIGFSLHTRYSECTLVRRCKA